MFIVHVHCSFFMFIVHCSHGATLIFDDLFCTKLTQLKLTKIAKPFTAILVTTKAREGALLLIVLVLFDNLLLMFW